ncbi:MAG: hypothetical protein LUE17_00630, partial [Planctomycetaceae bacterium]|nr:hypothetical protein [Planctomycetaceae bacterium]
FFMLTGGDQPLRIALKAGGVEMIVARSEASAVYMADGYARARGRPSVVYGQAGPGAANVAAALADPLWAQSPVVAVTGATATGFRHVNEYQDLDQFALFDPVTRWNARAENPGQVTPLLRQALQMAMAGNPAPTHLDIPKDFFAMPSTAAERDMPPIAQPTAQTIGDGRVAGDMAELLRRAERPIILVGEGVRFAGAWDTLAAFSAKTGIPMVATMGGKPAVLASHPNFIGVVGRYSAVTANAILGDADVVLVLGSRLGGLATRGYGMPSRKATVLQVDRDPAAFANPYCPEVCLQSDMATALAQVEAALGGEKLAPAWLDRCTDAAAAWRREVEQAVAGDEKPGVVSPMAFLASLSRYAKEITLVADTGYMAAWTGVLFPTARYDSFFRATGSLG